MQLKTRSKLLCCVAVVSAIGSFTLAGCAAFQNSQAVAETDAVVPLTEVAMGAEKDLQLPKIMADDKGDSFQRTPTDTYADGNSSSLYPDKLNDYNNRFLAADGRGCYACHDDLAQTLNDMNYDHPNLVNNYGIQTTVQMCIDCHTTAHGYVEDDNNFGQLMHNIHEKERSATCQSCHVMTENNGVDLWDEVKYDWLHGIKDIESVDGDFSFTQDSVRHRADGDVLADFLETGWANMLDWGPNPGEPGQATPNVNDTPLDQEMFDTWTITVSGKVEKEVTFTLPELIEKAPSVDLNLKMSCDWNPLGGPYISNAAVRGIPLSWLLEQAGAENMYGFTSVSRALTGEGNMPQNYFEFVTKTDGQVDDDAYLVYQLDGTPLTWSEGYPVGLWVGGYSSAGPCTKQVSDIIVYDEAGFKEMNKATGYGYNGWTTAEGDAGIVADLPEQQGWYINKPCVGVFNNREGRIMKLGDSYTFEGYADSFNNEIVAMEFSLDGGNTWTSYATEGATDDRWVNWKFEYTPDTEGAYVLHIRSKNINGLVTPEPIELMFNVQVA